MVLPRTGILSVTFVDLRDLPRGAAAMRPHAFSRLVVLLLCSPLDDKRRVAGTLMGDDEDEEDEEEEDDDLSSGGAFTDCASALLHTTGLSYPGGAFCGQRMHACMHGALMAVDGS